MVPACHDILVFGQRPDVARPVAAARSGSLKRSESTKALKNARLSVTRHAGSAQSNFAAKAEAEGGELWTDRLGEHGGGVRACRLHVHVLLGVIGVLELFLLVFMRNEARTFVYRVLSYRRLSTGPDASMSAYHLTTMVLEHGKWTAVFFVLL